MHVLQAGAFHALDVLPLDPGKIRVSQVSTVQDCSCKLGAAEVRRTEVTVAQIGALQLGAAQVAVSEVS